MTFDFCLAKKRQNQKSSKSHTLVFTRFLPKIASSGSVHSLSVVSVSAHAFISTKHDFAGHLDGFSLNDLITCLLITYYYNILLLAQHDRLFLHLSVAERIPTFFFDHQDTNLL